MVGTPDCIRSRRTRPRCGIGRAGDVTFIAVATTALPSGEADLAYLEAAPISGLSQAYSRAMVDWSQCPLVESDPQRVHGAWVFRDTRLPVSIVFECLAKGATIEDIIQWYGGVTRDQIEKVINFVADSLEEPVHANSV